MSLDRQTAKDMTWQEARDSGFDIVQIKYDGIWCRVDHMGCLYSRTGQLKAQVSGHPVLDCNLIGEYMYGSNWSQHESRKGLIFLYDCGYDLSAPYIERYKALKLLQTSLAVQYVVVKNYPIHDVEYMWNYVNKNNYEGLIFRRSGDTYRDIVGRQKVEVTDDYYCREFYEGKGKHAGTLGAIGVSTTPGGPEVMRVGGGFSDDERDRVWMYRHNLRGMCIEVKGKARFPSGALRHPNFYRARWDKTSITNQAALQQVVLPVDDLLTD